MLDTYKQILEFFGFKADPIAGLEIGVNEVKLMQLSKHKGRVQVDCYAIEPIESEDKDGIVIAIKNAILSSKIKTKKVCVAIASSKVMSKIINMSARLNHRDIACEIELEIDKYFPYPMEEITFDYTITNAVSNAKEIEVLLSAVKLQQLTEITTVVNAACLTPVAIEVDAYAIARAFTALVPRKYENAVLFEINSKLMIIIVINHSRILYVREQILTDPKSLTLHIIQLYTDFLTTDPAIIIDGIYLFGIGADKADLKHIERELLIPSYVFDLSTNLHLPPEISAQQFKREALGLMQCCGLALRNIN